MQKIDSLKNALFNSGFFILTFISTTLIYTSLMFLFKVSISGYTFLLSLLLATGIYLFLYRSQDNSEKFYGILIAFVIFIISLFFCQKIYDLSSDGNWYHKSTLGSLTYGWNPVYESLTTFANNSEIGIRNLENSAIWSDHYCKASWIFGANVYAVTHDIETGKVMNLLMAYVLFVFAIHYLSSDVLNIFQSVVVSFLAIFNPLTLSQAFSFYVDNLLMTTFFIVILLLICITDKRYVLPNKIKFFALFSALIICINIKFTGLVYSGFFCLFFYVLWLINSAKKCELRKTFISSTVFYAVTCSVAILLVGLSSYTLNTVQHGNPFYPLAGEGKKDIMTGNQPNFFDKLSGPKRLFYSIFSETANLMGDSEPPKLKIPFSVSAKEIETSNNGIDIRIGGFGPLFSGIFCLSVPIVIFELLGLRKRYKKWFNVAILLLGGILILLLLIKESWWARYSPYFYLLPLISLSFLFNAAHAAKGMVGKISLNVFAVLFAICIFINSNFFIHYPLYCVEKTVEIKNSLSLAEKMSTKNKPITIQLSTYAFYGLEFNLKDNNIHYIKVNNIAGNTIKLYDYLAIMEVK